MLTSDDNVIISIVGLISAILSMLGSLSVMIMFVLFRRLRRFKERLVLYTSISNFIWTFSIATNLIWFISQDGKSTDIPDGFCKATAFMLQWFVISYNFWIVSIAVYLFLLLVRRIDSASKEWVYHLICWPIPFIIACVPFSGTSGGYALAGTWCWVKDAGGRLLYSYTFAWATFVIILVIYCTIIVYIKKTGQSVEHSLDEKQLKIKKHNDRKAFKKLAAFPIIFLVQWIPATINRAQNYANPENPLVWLFCIHLFFVMGSGVMVAIFYGGFNRKTIARDLPSWCPCSISSQGSSIEVTKT